MLSLIYILLITSVYYFEIVVVFDPIIPDDCFVVVDFKSDTDVPVI